MCAKQRYPTASEARRGLRAQYGRKFRKDRTINVYRCPECRDNGANYWHIGHRSAA